MRLEHVNLTVTDPERTAALFADVLDLHIRWKGDIGGGRLGVHVGTDDQYLALFEAATETPVDRDMSAPGINHFGFVVDDLDEAESRLRAAGITRIVNAQPYDPGRRLYFRDFDDNEVELVQY